MSKLTSNQVSQNSSKLNISNITSIQKKKAINYQEIISLKKLLKHEVREAKGQELVNTYIKLLEKQYENLIEKSINNSELIKAHKNNRIFQKVLDKTKNKIKQQNSKSISKKNSLNNTRSLSVSNKISTSKSSLNISPIKKINKKIDDEILNEENNKQSTYWQDYDFLKVPLHPKQSPKKIKKKNPKGNNSLNKKFNNITTVSKSKANNSQNKQLENYYLYLLNRRQKICENEETDEDRQQEKIELEILRQIFEKIYNDDEKLKKNLEDESIPEFYKRFIIQNEIRKDNIFSKEFKLNYNESQNLEGPKLCNKSRLICKYAIDYEPIYKRLDKIIKNQKKNLDKIKMRLVKNKNRKNSEKKNNVNDTKEWLKSMDNWNERKNKKIKEKKAEIEKNNPDNKECKFKPVINPNARIRKDDEGLLCSDRLYLEYFTLREKKQQMIEKEKNNFSFQPNVNYRKNFVSPNYAF